MCVFYVYMSCFNKTLHFFFFNITEIYFLMLLETWSPRSRWYQGWFLVRPLFLTCSMPFYFFILYFFYWSITALQWCVSFCFITKWISYTYTYIPISPPSCILLPPSLSHFSRWSQITELISLCYVAASHYASLFKSVDFWIQSPGFEYQLSHLLIM